MNNKILMLVLLFLMTGGTVMAQQATVTPLVSKDLTDLPGKEVSMITVEYHPGGTDPIHRHNAHAFIYVLEGSIVMQVKGGKEVTLTPGQTFYEGLAIGSPLNEIVDLAGPEQFRFNEFISRGLSAREDPREVIADPHARYFGTELSEGSLVPSGAALLGEMRFEDWLSQPTAKAAASK